MKKLLSVLLALCVILSTSLTAFAANKPSSEKVWQQVEGATAYLTEGVETYGVDSAITFAPLTFSGSDVEKYSDAFIADVKANLERNNGKIVSAYGENLATYGAVIAALVGLGENPADFYGFNIEKAFLALDPTEPCAIPSYYRYITLGVLLCEDETTAATFMEKVCDTYISNYYTMGKGANYYGYSCDNTANFVEAVAFASYYTDKYTDVLNDAVKVINTTYKVEGGYCYSPEYGTEPNANSTALALSANISWPGEDIADIDTYYDFLNGIYADLCTFEGSSAGIFTYDGEDNKLATQDALPALSDFYIIAIAQEDGSDPDPDETENTTVPAAKPTVTDKKDTTKSSTTAKTNTSKKSPATGASAGVIALSAAIACAGFTVVCAKKKEQ